VLDYESRFKTAVIDRFAELRAARRRAVRECTSRSSSTICWRTARELGAKRSRRHYVRRGRLADGSRALFRAREEARDQSISVRTTREQLEFVRFPLGDRPRQRCASSRAASPRGRRQETAGHLLRAGRPLQRRDRR